MTLKLRVTEELVNYLNELFPDRCPEITNSEKEVWFKAGQRSVVNHLIVQKQIQEEK